MNTKSNYHHIYEKCKDHMHAYVLLDMVDGTKMDGIITGLDEENVVLAIPNESEANYRQFGPGYGYGYGGYPPYGYFPPRRFQRLVLPLAAIAAISLLPWY